MSSGGGFQNFFASNLTTEQAASNLNNLPYSTVFSQLIAPSLAPQILPQQSPLTNRRTIFSQQYAPSHTTMNHLAFPLAYQQMLQDPQPQSHQHHHAMNQAHYPYQLPYMFSLQHASLKSNNSDASLNDMVSNIMNNQSHTSPVSYTHLTLPTILRV